MSKTHLPHVTNGDSETIIWSWSICGTDFPKQIDFDLNNISCKRCRMAFRKGGFELAMHDKKRMYAEPIKQVDTKREAELKAMQKKNDELLQFAREKAISKINKGDARRSQLGHAIADALGIV